MNQSNPAIKRAVRLDVEAGSARTTYPTRRLIDRVNPHQYTNASSTDISVHLKRYKALQQKQLKVAGSKK